MNGGEIYIDEDEFDEWAQHILAEIAEMQEARENGDLTREMMLRSQSLMNLKVKIVLWAGRN